MEEEVKQSGEAQAEDPIKNVKAEFDRKLANVQQAVSEEVRAQLESQKELLQQLTASSQRDVAKDYVIDEDEWLTNSKEAAKKLEDKILNKVDENLTKSKKEEADRVASQQSTFQELAAEFPELYVQGSDLLTKANAEFQAKPVGQRNDPEVMRSVVYKHALNLGLKPKSMRSKDDEFVASGSRGSRPGPKDEGQIDDNMKEFARLLGRPVDDPKYQERLKNAAARKSWLKYQ